jgi:hypothetical protein
MIYSWVEMHVAREVSFTMTRVRLNVVTMMSLPFALLFAIVSPLAAQPSKAKEATTKQSSVAELKPAATAPGAPATSPTVDPVVCLPPSDADASKPATNDDKAIFSSPAKNSTDDTETRAESGSDSSAEFMKDKLKLSLGGKSGAAADQPQQCQIDEAGAADKDKEKEK